MRSGGRAVTTTLFGIISEIKRDIDRKLRSIHTPISPGFDAPVQWSPIGILQRLPRKTRIVGLPDGKKV